MTTIRFIAKLAKTASIFTLVGALASVSFAGLPSVAKAEGYLGLSAFSGNPGVTLSVSGGGYTAGETVSIYMQSVSGSPVTNAVANGIGQFTAAAVTIPVTAPQGPVAIIGLGETSHSNFNNSYFVQPFAPTLAVNGSSNTPSSSITVAGSGFAPNEMVTVALATSATSTPANSVGAFTTTLTIPNVAPQTYLVNATGLASHAIAVQYFYVGGFFANAYPSNFFLLPDQTLSFSGSGFASGELIQVVSYPSLTLAASFSAGPSGSFTNKGSVPMLPSYANSSRTFRLIGTVSGSQIPVTVNVGSFNTQVTPSGFFLLPGQSLNFSGTGFGASELVTVMGPGATPLSTIMTDTFGAFSATGTISVPYSYSGTSNIFTLVGSRTNTSGTAAITVGTLNPTAEPSSYYVQPGFSLSFTGSGFAPSEVVHVLKAGTATEYSSFTTSASGTFASLGGFTVPYSAANTQMNLSLKGGTSAAAATVSVTVASMDPQLTLSNYYILPGGAISVTGTGFAPNEDVSLQVTGGVAVTAHTVANGSFGVTSVSAPFASPGSKTLTATGQTSGSVSSVSISVGSYYPGITADNYYALPGSVITFTGSGFAPSETVTVKKGMTTLSTGLTTGAGNFTASSTIPYGSVDSALFTFTGSDSGASVSLSIGVASFYPGISADNYYVRPGNSVNVSFSGFIPNEQVKLTAGSFTKTVPADGSGAGSAQSVTIPLGSTGSISIKASGVLSGALVATTVTLAPFYLNVSPSTYYAQPGSSISFTGEGFAPSEGVTISWDGGTEHTVASAGGTMSAGPYAVPYGATEVAYTFSGDLSGASQTVTVGVAGIYANAALSNYYDFGGAPVTITGSGFASGETLTIKFGGTTLPTLNAAVDGTFSYSTQVPYAPAGDKVVTITGSTSHAVATTGFTQAQMYVNLQLGEYANKPGSHITFIGSGFSPNETVIVTNSRDGSTYSFSSDASGTFSDSGFVIPASFAEGTLDLTATGQHSFAPTTITYYVTGQ